MDFTESMDVSRIAGMIIDLAGEFRQKVFLAAMLECAMLLPVVSIKSAMKPRIRYGGYFGAVRQR